MINIEIPLRLISIIFFFLFFLFLAQMVPFVLEFSQKSPHGDRRKLLCKIFLKKSLKKNSESYKYLIAMTFDFSLTFNFSSL